MKGIFSTIKNFLVKNWLLLVILLVIFFVFFGGFNVVRSWFKNMRITSNESAGVKATEIYSNLHGSILGFQPNFFNTNEKNVVKIINSLESYSDFSNVVSEYSKSYGKDLREDLNVELGSYYENLKFK